MSKLKLLSLFSGIGAFEKALSRLKVNYEIVGFSEIDKWAITSYCAIHNVDKNLNLGDVSKINVEDIPNCDLITYGFPCTDTSVAGKQKGIIHGKTRSGLLYDALRIINTKKPKYAIAENVKNLVGKRFKDDFNNLLKELSDMGYNSYWKVLNAKDYGIPQNRERVFIISIRKDVDNGKFEFPEPFDNGLRLKDLLEGEVDDKYYISDENINNALYKLGNELPHQEISYCIDANYSKDTTLDSFINKKRRQLIQRLKRKEFSNSVRIGGRGSLDRHQWDLVVEENNNILDQHEIRRLIPLECYRLMGFDDEDYWIARTALEQQYYNGKDKSDSQMYKQAGNSIVVDVLECIFKDLFKDYILDIYRREII